MHSACLHSARFRRSCWHGVTPGTPPPHSQRLRQHQHPQSQPGRLVPAGCRLQLMLMSHMLTQHRMSGRRPMCPCRLPKHPNPASPMRLPRMQLSCLTPPMQRQTRRESRHAISSHLRAACTPQPTKALLTLPLGLLWNPPASITLQPTQQRWRSHTPAHPQQTRCSPPCQECQQQHHHHLLQRQQCMERHH